jgi:hypothetical protein
MKVPWPKIGRFRAVLKDWPRFQTTKKTVSVCFMLMHQNGSLRTIRYVKEELQSFSNTTNMPSGSSSLNILDK